VTRLLAIPLVVLALLAGAFVWSGGTAQRRADFAYFDRGDVFTLDLNQISYMQDFRMCYAIREGLYATNVDTYESVPSGATHHEVSEDKRVWTFHLNKKCRSDNNDPVTAHDYIFSFRRMLEEPGEYTYLFFMFKNAEDYSKAYVDGGNPDFNSVGIAALDDHTLRLELINPLTYMLELMTFPVFYPRHEKSMEPFKVPQPNGRYTYRADYTRPAPRPGAPGVVTNGPYTLKQWDFKQRLILEKSPTYWDRDNVGTPRIEKVVNDNVLSQFLTYETGGIDWMSDVPGELAAELKAKNRTDLHTSPAFGSMFITLLRREKLPDSLGGGKNPLADLRVRQALAMSVDKQFIVDHITRIGELPARTYLPPDGTLADFRYLPGPYDKTRTAENPYSDVELRAQLSSPHGLASHSGPGLPYDVTLARKLLAEAGYPNGQGFPPLPILFNTENPVRAKIAPVLKTQWKQALNIDITIQNVEGKIFKERVSKKDYAIATVAWYGDYADASTFTDKYLSTSLQNDSDWQNPAFDALCQQAQKESDPVIRGKLLSQAEHMIDTEMPIIPIYHYQNAYLYRDTVKGVEPNPRLLVDFKKIRVNGPDL
jgi:oligopeptide transport system substrate-binding protein